MRVTIAPTDSGLLQGQHTASIERSGDDLGVLEVIEMVAAALVAYGSDHETIVEAFEHYALSHQLHEEAGDESRLN